MRLATFLLIPGLALSAACSSSGGDSAGLDTAGDNPIRLGTYSGEKQSSTQLVYVYSPWEPGEYMTINFPEHCWGNGLPNVGHNSEQPMTSPWEIAPDSMSARLERTMREGVVYRSLAGVDSMAVRLALEIENSSETPISDIRTLVCARPATMDEFSSNTYEPDYVAVDGQKTHLDRDTHYDGPMPERLVAWSLNVKGGPDNREFEDLGWFKPGSGPGRIVQERAWPPLIALRGSGEPERWLATIWHPARLLFANPNIPCIHSDPLPPDCPAGGKVRVEGLVLFHEGSFESLVERARREMGL